MNETELEHARTLWKMFYAREYFAHAQFAAEHIHTQKLEPGNPLFYPLVTSVYVLYGKPFKHARVVGKLDDRIVPRNYLKLHKMLLSHRDKVYAHTDGDGIEIPVVGKANQVRVSNRQGEMRLFATQFHARFPLMSSVIELCSALQKSTNYHVNKLFCRYKSKVPRIAGEYAININDSSGEFFTKAAPILDS